MTLRRANIVLHVANVARYRAQLRHGLIYDANEAPPHLVQLLDEVFDLMAAESSFRYFTLDGETSLIETYLKMRPERTSQVETFANEGRLLLGPWYIAPEPALTNVESLIRNLLLGLRIARRFGKPLLVGYLPEAAGLHTALPQILRSFGIHTAITSASLAEQPIESLYHGLDGTKLIVGNLREETFEASDTLITLRDKLAPHSDSKHLLILSKWQFGTSVEDLQLWQRRLKDTEAQTSDEVRESHPAAFAKALEVNLLNSELPALSHHFELTPSGRAVRDWNIGITRGIVRWLEPFFCWAENAGLGRSEADLRHPQALIRELWRQVLQDQSELPLHEPHRLNERTDRSLYYRDRVDDLRDVPLHALTENVNTASLPQQGIAALIVFNSGSVRCVGTFRDRLGWARTQPEQDRQFVLTVFDQNGQRVGGAVPTEDVEFVQELLFMVDVPGFGFSSYSIVLEPIESAVPLPKETGRTSELLGYITAFHAGILAPSASLITVSDWRFEITAIKLPEDETRRGIILRGSNRDEQPLSVTISPWRTFKFCDVVTMDELPTGAKMKMDAAGAFTFKAAAHRILTFWLHD